MDYSKEQVERLIKQIAYKISHFAVDPIEISSDKKYFDDSKIDIDSKELFHHVFGERGNILWHITEDTIVDAETGKIVFHEMDVTSTLNTFVQCRHDFNMLLEYYHQKYDVPGLDESLADYRYILHFFLVYNLMNVDDAYSCSEMLTDATQIGILVALQFMCNNNFIYNNKFPSTKEYVDTLIGNVLELQRMSDVIIHNHETNSIK